MVGNGQSALAKRKRGNEGTWGIQGVTSWSGLDMWTMGLVLLSSQFLQVVTSFGPILLMNQHIVDGRNPAPPGICKPCTVNNWIVLQSDLVWTHCCDRPSGLKSRDLPPFAESIKFGHDMKKLVPEIYSYGQHPPIWLIYIYVVVLEEYEEYSPKFFPVRLWKPWRLEDDRLAFPIKGPVLATFQRRTVELREGMWRNYLYPGDSWIPPMPSNEITTAHATLRIQSPHLLRVVSWNLNTLRFVSVIVHPNHPLTRWARIPPPRKTNQHPLKINGWFRCISYWKFVPLKRGKFLVLLTRGCLEPGARTVKTAVDLTQLIDTSTVEGLWSWSYPPMEGWMNLYGYGVFWGPKKKTIDLRGKSDS